MDTMKERILNAIKQHGRATCADIRGEIDGADGDFWSVAERFNTVTAFGFSEEAIEALADLMNEGAVETVHCPPELYLWDDGPIPNLPIATEPRYHEELHWLPTVWRAREMIAATTSPR